LRLFDERFNMAPLSHVNSSRLLNRLLSVGGLESAAEGEASAPVAAIHEAAKDVVADSRKRTELVAQFTNAIQLIEAEAAEVGDTVLISPQDRMACILQSVLAEHAERKAAEFGTLEFPFDKPDVRSVVGDGCTLHPVIHAATKNPVRGDGVSFGSLLPARNSSAIFPPLAIGAH
jgi:hypothetical protein